MKPQILLILLALAPANAVATDPSGFGAENAVPLVGVDSSGDCIFSPDLLGILDGLSRGDFETIVRLVDGDAAKRLDDAHDKPYQLAQLLKQLSKDTELTKKAKAARKYLETATFCPGFDVRARAGFEFSAGNFRLGMGNSLMEDKLTAAVVDGNPETGVALTVGGWKRVECWSAEAMTKPCGPVFRDMPREVRAVVENSAVELRWKWHGIPKRVNGFVMVPWRGGFAKQKTDLLVIPNPSLEFIDGERILWVAK